MTNSEKILKLESRLEAISDEIQALKATVNSTGDTEWQKVSEHGNPPINAMVQYWYCFKGKPDKTYTYVPCEPEFLHPKTRYRIIRTPEETERFIKHGAPLPIDSEEHEWTSFDKKPLFEEWIVARFNSGELVVAWTHYDDSFSNQVKLLDCDWGAWDIKDWRYCTPGEVLSE